MGSSEESDPLWQHELGPKPAWIAEINLNVYLEQLSRKVINISQVLDPNTRSAKLRIKLPNPRGLMRSGMFVTATFRAIRPAERVVVPVGGGCSPA
jgi:multidrug efflux pump subunit AcrA (membrane-fusion protein)